MKFGVFSLVLKSIALSLLVPSVLPAQQISTDSAAGERHVYKTVEGRDLHLYITNPTSWNTGSPKAAVVFFHGGGWIGGTPASFNTQAKAVADNGAIGITVEYRLLDKPRTHPPQICVEDTKSAIRWLRQHAKELNLDPNRIAGSGGSAGGYDIAYAAVAPGWDDPHDDLSISPRPNALVLYNPVIDTSPNGYANSLFGDETEKRSPMTYASKDWVPTLVQSGGDDKLIHAEVLNTFQKKLQALGVRFDLKIYPGRQHGFFNNEPDRSETTTTMVQFLASLGYLDASANTSSQIQSPSLPSAAKATTTQH